MKYQKLALLLAFVTLFAACATTHSARPNLPQQPAPLPHHRPPGFWENKQAIVQIQMIYTVTTTDADGSDTTIEITQLGVGAVVDVNGLVITDNHVIVEDPEDLKKIVTRPILSASQEIKICTVTKGVQHCNDAEVVAADKAHDLAKLHTNQHFPRTVTFIDNSELVPGDELYYWGNVDFLLPLSPFYGSYVGTIEPPYKDSSDDLGVLMPLLLVDGTAIPASSGGPVFDELGRCVGLTDAYWPSVPGPRPVDLVTPSSTVMKFDKENPYLPPKK